MLTNLFSMFDPTMLMYNPFLFLLLFFFFILQMNYNVWINNNFMFNSNKVLFFMKKEFVNEMIFLKNKKKNVKNKGVMKMFLMFMLMIFFFNFLSLFPSIMSITSHVSLNLPLTIICWLMTVLIGLKISWKNFFSHLTPVGTPLALMSFMVLIETISNIIRPITLSVRLMANMVAGHLLLTLLSNFSMLSVGNYFLGFTMMIILTGLELGVSLIQSYVITLLLLLYFKEVF